MKLLSTMIGAALAVSAGAAAHASSVTLDFSGFQDFENPGNFYAGGLASLGSGPGPNLGVTFSAEAIVACTLGLACDDPRGAETAVGVLRFLSKDAQLVPEAAPRDFIDVASGFSQKLSFDYGSTVAGSILLWSGVDGTGDLLGTLDLGATCTFKAEICDFNGADTLFTGVAHSVEFVGYNFELAGFDNVTLGAANAGGVPEPASWALMIGGFGLAGASLRSRRRRASVA